MRTEGTRVWKWRIAWGVAAVLAAAALAWAFAPRPVAVETARVEFGPYEEAVEDDARTRVRQRVAVTLPWSGELQRPAWREGQWVRRGEVLLQVRAVAPSLRDPRTQAELQARLASAHAAWQRAARQAEGAHVAWQRAAVTAARALALATEGFISHAQVESAALDLQRDERAWQAARQAERAALHDLEQARVSLGIGDGAGSSPIGVLHSVRATQDVQVLRVLQAHEAVLPAGTAVLEVGDTRDPEVVMPLLSQEALGILPGATVRLSGWTGGDPAAGVTGRVRVVEPAAMTKVSALGLEEQRVNVWIDPSAPLPPGDGYALRAQVLRVQEPRALRVPGSAVFSPPGIPQALAVFVVDGGRARLQPVQARRPGRRGLDAAVWIETGLQEGQTVVVFPPASLADGTRVEVLRR